MKTCAEISKEATLEDKKEDPIPENLEEVHIKSRTTQALTSPSQMKQTKGVCQAQSH
jgi:hypothetical protein